MNKTRCIFCTLSLACFALPAVAQTPVTVTLKQAANLALQNSKDVVLAKAKYTVAMNATDVSGSAFRPHLYTGSGAGFSYGIPQTVAGAAPSIANMSYLQTIYNPLLRGQVLETRERAEIQRLEVERTRNAVVLQTVSAYLELATVRHSIERVREQKQNKTRILDFTHQRQSEGLERPVDVRTVEVEMAKIDQHIVQLENRQEALEDQLAVLMGSPIDRGIQLDADGLTLDALAAPEDLLKRALESNPELLEAEHERRARERRLEGEKAAKWPTLDLGAEYQILSKSDNYEDFFRKFQRNNVRIGVQFQIPIFSGDRSSKITLAKNELTVAEIELKTKRQNLELEIKRQYRNIRELDAARTVAQLYHKLAQEKLQLVQVTFEEGRANLRDVENARLDENERWIAYLDSDYQRKKAELELLNTTGELSTLFERRP